MFLLVSSVHWQAFLLDGGWKLEFPDQNFEVYTIRYYCGGEVGFVLLQMKGMIFFFKAIHAVGQRTNEATCWG